MNIAEKLAQKCDNNDLRTIAKEVGMPLSEIKSNISTKEFALDIVDWVNRQDNPELLLTLEKKVEGYSNINSPGKDNKKWQRAKNRIEGKYPHYVELLNLPEILPVPVLDERELQPTPYFTGRDNLCEEIYKELDNKKSLNIYALNGIGGIGKSEVAKQVSVKLQENKVFEDGYLWISLESVPKETILADIAQKFDIFNLSKIINISEQKDILSEILKATDPLVILDNADDPDSLRTAYDTLKGKTILITSRKRCSMAVKAKDLEDLSVNDSVNLYCEIYCKKTGMTAPESQSEFREKHHNTLEEISRRLSGHPLSIEIVASLAAYYTWMPMHIL
ncbi:MAG: hypothetical protein GY749_00430 [Desulfobacteraceae bacterium]|nr:hypothetical protein [Desulfobacteraceae bacterium]